MSSQIVSSGQQSASNSLPERMDAAIGETSSGIGVLLSELVRRSLRTGVADIGDSLTEYAHEAVETAVERQMPAVAEAADSVAESTSTRVVGKAIEEVNQKATVQRQELESKIEAAASTAVEQSRAHTETVLGAVRESLGEAKSLATEGITSADQKISELRDKARRSWKKVSSEFTALHATCQQLSEQNQQLQRQLQEAKEQQRQQVAETAKRHAELQRLTQSFEERLAVLEQPRGLKAMFSRLRGGKKSQPGLPPASEDA
jgi:uncharacterized phage infection (PIP) family protein YhgE